MSLQIHICSITIDTFGLPSGSSALILCVRLSKFQRIYQTDYNGLILPIFHRYQCGHLQWTKPAKNTFICALSKMTKNTKESDTI